MKKFLLFFALVVMAHAGFAQEKQAKDQGAKVTINADEGDILGVGDEMPEFTIVSDNGTKISSASLKGKVVLINFFATWCPPCQKELAEIQSVLWPKYKDNPDFKLLVIGREHNDEELQKYNERKGFTFPLYPDKSRSIYSKFAKNLIPRSYLIGKDGKIIYVSKGYTDEEFEELMHEIATALAK